MYLYRSRRPDAADIDFSTVGPSALSFCSSFKECSLSEGCHRSGEGLARYGADRRLRQVNYLPLFFFYCFGGFWTARRTRQATRRWAMIRKGQLRTSASLPSLPPLWPLGPFIHPLEDDPRPTPIFATSPLPFFLFSFFVMSG